MAIFDLDRYPVDLLAAASFAVAIGGTDVVEMKRLRDRGASLREIARLFRTSDKTVAYRLGAAERRHQQVVTLLDSLAVAEAA